MIVVNLDVMMAKRKISSGELAEKVGITPANLSILKTNKAKAIRFSTLEKICEVLECKPVKKSKKLLVSKVRIGDEVRQIVSGISIFYKPEEMVGKKVAVVTNLKPCKLCGVESQGMILAASDDKGNLCVVSPEKDMIAGSEIC